MRAVLQQLVKERNQQNIDFTNLINRIIKDNSITYSDIQQLAYMTNNSTLLHIADAHKSYGTADNPINNSQDDTLGKK